MSSSNPHLDGLSVEDAFDQAKGVVGDVVVGGRSICFAIWHKKTRRLRATGVFILFMIATLSLWRHSYSKYEIPTISIEYNSVYNQQSSPFNQSKVALLIENRPLPLLAPLVLHFMGVVPPDWRFKFMGSKESVASINASLAIRNQVATGKLDITYIPSNVSTDDQEGISRFLTNKWLYEQLLSPAEWLLVFQTDSVLCANAAQSINNWLDYDWVGAPWHRDGSWGGNGGLSLRRVSAILDILRYATREDFGKPEDVWLAELLATRPGAHMANGTASMTFSGEQWSGDTEDLNNPTDPSSDKPTYIKGIDDWRNGGYEPMGYHTGGGGATMHAGIWGTPEMRKHIWDYCPEVKMIFPMDAAEYVPGDCNSKWTRAVSDEGTLNDNFVWDENNVDENGYPYLPPNLLPW